MYIYIVYSLFKLTIVKPKRLNVSRNREYLYTIVHLHTGPLFVNQINFEINRHNRCKLSIEYVVAPDARIRGKSVGKS